MSDEVVRTYERTICVANHSDDASDKYETIKVGITIKRGVKNIEELDTTAKKVGQYVKQLVEKEVEIIKDNLKK